MSISCPYCTTVLNPKGLKPGTFQPSCPKCKEKFILIVPTEDGADPITRKIAIQPAPAATSISDDPNATSASLHSDPNTTSVAGTAHEDPNATSASINQSDPNATGDFTDADGTAADPNATGDFTQGDPNATGDFTESDPQATGDYTEATRGRATRPGMKGTVANRADVTDGAAGDRSEQPSKTKSKKNKGEFTEDDIPPKLGGYEVTKILGKGGMGAVLLGRQISLDRKVALKVMHPRIAKDPGFVARFTREAYAAAQLTHHNVIQIYDIGEDQGTHFFSMEFVNGKSLMDLVKKDGKLDAELAVGYILQAARGLKYGHNQGMVHRDIKPDNLMLNTDGIVKVADLGLVKLPSGEVGTGSKMFEEQKTLTDEGEEDTQLTRTGSAMGTPAYMAPEQARDSSTVDARADIYSLGCSLYVMVTGKPPFEGKTALEVMSKHQTDPIVPPEVIVKRVPKALSGILQKMLAKKPEDRYQSMDDVIIALEGFLGISRGGDFNPKEEQATTLERASEKFNQASKAKQKSLMAGIFAVICLIGLIGSGLAGQFTLAGGFLGLGILTPLSYFIIHGIMQKSYLFSRFRELVMGAKITDWLMYIGYSLLALLTLWIFDLLFVWIGFCVLAIGLAFVLWYLTDKPEQAGQKEPLEEVKVLIRSMRLQGIEEETLRQFICKYSGANWEPMYESLFGYEDTISARAYRKGATGENTKKHAAWREPILTWMAGRVQARKEAAERKYLQRLQAKALEAEGVSASDAREQAEEMAEAMVGQVAEIRTARSRGQAVNLKEVVQLAQSRKPKPGFNLAGVALRQVRLKYLLENWVGRRLRLLLGAFILFCGVMWVKQNPQLIRAAEAVTESVSKQVEGQINQATKGTEKASKTATQVGDSVAKGASQITKIETKPLSLPVVPGFITGYFNSFAAVIGGFLLIVTGLIYSGWRVSLIAVPGALFTVVGPSLLASVPFAGAISAVVGGILMLFVSRILRG
jgi:eukaryotic-like serine/threonine-protein kinase